MKINVDTVKMKNAGESMLAYTNAFKADMDSLKKRMDRMLTTTFEWEGNAADTFVANVDKQINELDSMVNALKMLGNELIEEASRYEVAAKNTYLR